MRRVLGQSKWITYSVAVAVFAFTTLWFYQTTTKTTDQVEPTPSIIKTELPDFFPGWYLNNGILHIHLNEATIWEPGDNGSDTYEIVRDTLQIDVDGVQITDLTIGQLTTHIARFSETGELLGSHGGGFHISFDAAHLSSGPHLATISLQTNRGRSLAHNWVFVVD